MRADSVGPCRQPRGSLRQIFPKFLRGVLAFEVLPHLCFLWLLRFLYERLSLFAPSRNVQGVIPPDLVRFQTQCRGEKSQTARGLALQTFPYFYSIRRCLSAVASGLLCRA